MKLNSNSLSSKLYRWFYGTNDLPNNFCPYFWKLLLAWVTLIPYALFCTPVIIYELIDKHNNRYEYSDNSVGERLGYSIGIYFLLILIGLIRLVEYIRERNKQRKIKYDENGRRIREEPKPNLFIEFIKAKYNKHCPRIDWD